MVLAASVVAASAAGVRATCASSIDGAGPNGPEEALDKKIAVWRFDALGIDAEIVQRLETLFRLELDRLDKVPLPSRRDIESQDHGRRAELHRRREVPDRDRQAARRRLRRDRHGRLARRQLRAQHQGGRGRDRQVAEDPEPAAQGHARRADRRRARRRVQPARARAAARLAASAERSGRRRTSRSTASRSVRRRSPNQGVIAKLALGKHKLHVEAKDYAPFDDDVDVHFQKVSPVVVRLVGIERDHRHRPHGRRSSTHPIYTRTWFIVGAGVVVVGLAALIGDRPAGHVHAATGSRAGAEAGCSTAIAIVAVMSATAFAERVVAVAPLSTLGAEDKSATTKKVLGQIEQALASLGNKVIAVGAGRRGDRQGEEARAQGVRRRRCVPRRARQARRCADRGLRRGRRPRRFEGDLSQRDRRRERQGDALDHARRSARKRREGRRRRGRRGDPAARSRQVSRHAALHDRCHRRDGLHQRHEGHARRQAARSRCPSARRRCA